MNNTPIPNHHEEAQRQSCDVTADVAYSANNLKHIFRAVHEQYMEDNNLNQETEGDKALKGLEKILNTKK